MAFLSSSWSWPTRASTISCATTSRSDTPASRGALLARLWEAAEVLDVMNLRCRLLHLDVKPHNLLLLGGHAKVADFGLVSRLPRSPAEGPTCRPGVVSPVYASPEAFQGCPSPSSDQYSLAVSYHELLTGELPFRAANVRQMALQHAHAEPDLSGLPEADRGVVALRPVQGSGQALSVLHAIRRGAAGR